MELRILNGWKEISAHLARNVRTAQRWELQLGMPVHRPASRRRTAVIAFPDELDVWLTKNRSKLNGLLPTIDADTDPAFLRETLFRLQTETKELSAKLLDLEQHIRETHALKEKSVQVENPKTFEAYR